jgi:hypothetical protein
MQLLRELYYLREVHDRSNEPKESSAVEYLLVETEVVCSFLYIFISLMKPGDKDGQVLKPFK